MACHAEYVQYIGEQCSGAGEITLRKMFGEYGIYCDGKIFGLICDDQLYIKITAGGRALRPELETASPYEGAKPHFLMTDVDDRESLSAFVRATCEELPLPKPKKGGESTPLDYKKADKELYQPPKKPSIVDVPAMRYLAVRGKGDPNEAGGEYQTAIALLYAVAYTLKMSEKGPRKIEGYFPYVVPPLEGLWWQEGSDGIDDSRKEAFSWISMIRLPDFIKNEDVDWAITEAGRKKKLDCSKVEVFPYEEGLCVQCMHVGSYEEEPSTIAAMEAYGRKNGYAADFASGRYHHEIYLSDPRKCAPEKRKTVLRCPVKKTEAR